MRIKMIWFLSVVSIFMLPLARAEHSTASRPSGINWHQGSVESAFKKASKLHRPLFLYWGASWCPPCNRLKAEVFNQKTFQNAVNKLIPVYLDGDDSGAQIWAERLKVSVYPTLLVLNESAQELTRLPLDADAPQYVELIQSALNKTETLSSLLNRAVQSSTTAAPLTEKEWRRLAFYEWYLDQDNLVEESKLFDTLKTLYQKSKSAEESTRARIFLYVLSFFDPEKNSVTSAEAAQFLAVFESLLNDPQKFEWQISEMANSITGIFGFFKPFATPAKMTELGETYTKRVRQTLDSSKVQWARKAWLVNGLVKYEKWKSPSSFSEEFKKDIIHHVKNILKGAHGKLQKDSAISEALWAIWRLGEYDLARTLAENELKNSNQPAKLADVIAYSYKKAGQNDKALVWLEKEYALSQGPATKLQAGVEWLENVLELTPEDFSKIDLIVSSLFKNLFESGDGIVGRNRRRFDALKNGIVQWRDKAPTHQEAWTKIDSKLRKNCKKTECTEALDRIASAKK